MRGSGLNLGLEYLGLGTVNGGPKRRSGPYRSAVVVEGDGGLGAYGITVGRVEGGDAGRDET